MKWKNSFKKGSLAAFVTLALTGSALAMPTGGTVENGSVNVDAANFGANDAIANVANGATITPQTNSIINWEAFNIAQGEALHFNTTNAALLNRVTGAQMSELLGQMTQVGGNFLYLVNPNGIHIGGTASFDVSNLTLSTLNVASEDFLKYAAGENSNLYSSKDAAKGAQAITVDQGANFNMANNLTLQAGKITVADGVTFVVAAGTREARLNVIAADTFSVKEDEGAGSQKATTVQGNDAAFHGTVKADANRDADVTIAGSTVNLDRAKFRMPRGGLGVAAVQSATGETRVSVANEEAGSYTMTATAANVVQADGMEFEGNQRGIEITGGRVELKNTTVKAPGKIVIDAYNSYESKDHEKRTEYANEWRNERTSKADKDNVVYLENTKLLNADSAFGNSSPVEISGGKIELNNAEIASEERISLRALNSLHEIREKPMTQRNFVLKESDAQASSDNVIQLNNTKISVNRASWDDSSSWMHQYAPTYDITVLGGKVDVADDVKFSLNPDDHETELTVAAVKSYFQKEQGVSKIVTEQGNDVSFHAAVESSGKFRADMGIGGATVNLDRAKFHTPNGELSVQATQSSEDNLDGSWTETATATNVIQADGLEIVGNRNDTEFWGGKVELKNTTIKTPGEVQVYAYNTIKEDSSKTEDVTAGADNVVQLTNTKILNEGSDPQSYSNLRIRGGKIEMNGSELASEDEIRLEAFNSLHRVRGEEHVDKEFKFEANAENSIRLAKTKMNINRASWYLTTGARYTPKYSVDIFGGKVDVADDVTFGVGEGTNYSSLYVIAAESLSMKNRIPEKAITAQGNDVAFHGTVEAAGDRYSEVNIGGATVNLDRAKFRMPRGTFSAVAIASSADAASNSEATSTTTATAANVLQADGMAIEGDRLATNIYAGSINLKNTTIKTAGDVEIESYGSRAWNMRADTPTVDTLVSTTHAPTNTLTFKNTQVTGDRITMFGGKVQMKDSFAEAKSLQIAAAGTLKSMRRGYYAPAYELYPVADVDNTLYLEGTTLKSAANAMGYTGKTSLMGGRVASKDVGIQAAGLEIYAGKMESRDGSIYLTQGTPLHLDGTKIEAPSYRSLSSAANLVKGSEVKGQDVTFVAVQSYDGGTGKATVTKDNTLSLWGSKVEADRLSFLAGGVNAWKASEIKSQNAMSDHAADLVHADGAAFTMQRDETSHISEAGAELGAPRVSIAAAPKEPSSPLLPLTPDNAQLSEQDKENIDRGRSQATDIIASQAGTAAQSKALVEIVATLNETPNASTRQTAGVVGGMLTAIAEASTLTTEEKQALQIAVLDAYGPVQEAKAESDHRTQQAKADADRMTTTENTAAALPTAEEPQEAVHFVG